MDDNCNFVVQVVGKVPIKKTAVAVGACPPQAEQSKMSHSSSSRGFAAVRGIYAT